MRVSHSKHKHTLNIKTQEQQPIAVAADQNSSSHHPSKNLQTGRQQRLVPCCVRQGHGRDTPPHACENKATNTCVRAGACVQGGSTLVPSACAVK